MRYRLRTLLIILALGPPMLAGIWLGWKHHLTMTRQRHIKQLQSRYDAFSARCNASLAELEQLLEEGYRLEALSTGATIIPVKERVLNSKLRFPSEVERAMLLDAAAGE
ncbi:MAG TPA: hypothetical protein VGI40_03715 [Pirellulaceae bacterium]|jgi:UDP-3-O-acyl-N-acetylglucosamine deacetylase